MKADVNLRKKFLTVLLLFFVALAGSMVCPSPKAEAASVSRLKVKGTKLVNSKGKTVQLRGVSTHGLSWYPEYVNEQAFKYMKKNWKINVVRLAMYTEDYNGYCVGGSSNKKSLEKVIDKGVKAAKAAGLYVIIDWHILSDGNPTKHQSQAVSFFGKMAKKYSGCKNVIYEICNEPNGGTSWSTIKKYAEAVIKEIRKYDSKAVILVGTPNWSQDVDVAAKNPISSKYKNIMYTCHFYAGTHKQSYRNKLQRAINAGLPVFVSEFGICKSSGSGSLNKTQGKKWLNLLDKNKISYVAWNLSNKKESSALIKSSCKKTSGWTNDDLSSFGKWYVKWLKK